MWRILPEKFKYYKNIKSYMINTKKICSVNKGFSESSLYIS